MSEPLRQPEQTTAVDDVRRVREKIAEQHHGDFRSHMEETNRIFEELRKKLNMKLAPPPSADQPRRDGTRG